jgi:hypothetical protein
MAVVIDSPRIQERRVLYAIMEFLDGFSSGEEVTSLAAKCFRERETHPMIYPI